MNIFKSLLLTSIVSVVPVTAGPGFGGISGTNPSEESTGVLDRVGGWVGDRVDDGRNLVNGVVDRVRAERDKLMAYSSEDYSSPTRDADRSSQEGRKIIQMPDMHAQREYNTCGTISMARYLKHLGEDLDWDEFYEEATDRSLFRPLATTDVAGTLPNGALRLLRRYHRNFRLSENTTRSQIIENLINDRPVMVLLRVGQYGSGVPGMHWVVVVGYDLHNEWFYLYDTNGNRIYKSTFEQFEAAHHFERSSRLLNGAFSHLADVKPGSAIYCGPEDISASGRCVIR